MEDINKMSADQVAAELQSLRLERERLELEVLRETVLAQNARRRQLIEAIRKQADTIRRNELRRKQQQAACSHKKGGRGREGILAGNAPEFSIILQTEPWGETYIMCQRCQKEWRKPLAVLQVLNQDEFRRIVRMNRKGYKAELEEYNLALRMTTDNTASGSVLFGFQQNMDDAA